METVYRGDYENSFRALHLLREWFEDAKIEVSERPIITGQNDFIVETNKYATQMKAFLIGYGLRDDEPLSFLTNHGCFHELSMGRKVKLNELNEKENK